MSPDHYDPLRFNEAILPVLVREDGSYMSSSSQKLDDVNFP
jgi:hypothetical protein